VRAELRDRNTHTCGWTVIVKEFCSRVPSDRRSPLYHRGREAEGEESCMWLTKRQTSQRFNLELKLPRLSAKN
jgi:hypothetical protein